MGKNKEGLSRRDFLTAAAIGAAATAGAGSVGLLSGCSPSEQGPATTADSESKASSSSNNELNPQENFRSKTSDYSVLFQPLQRGKLTLKNRLCKSPAGSDTWEQPNGDSLNENYLTYYENFAKGGAAVVFTESAISAFNRPNVEERTHTGWFGGNLDQSKERMGPVVDRIHKHDAYAGFQVGAPSVKSVTDLTLDDLKWIQETIVNLALAYQRAGYDICELHMSQQQMLNLLMTSRANKRTDQYSLETFENRTRFACETIQMLKDALGKDYPIQILMNVAEDNDADLGRNDGLLTLQDYIKIAQALEAAGADTFYFRINVLGYHVAQFAPDLMFSGYQCEGVTGTGGRFDFSQHFNGALNGQWSGSALILKATAEMKKNLKVPVSCAGYMDPRISPEIINNAVANGEIDYLMMTRPLTVDPEYPNKLKAGKADEIAPCTRCMHCHNKGGPNGEVGDEWCRVNANTQHAFNGWNGRLKTIKPEGYEFFPEGYELVPAVTKKKVMVVGAGPAGMEAARIAAQRGHAVTLYEKDKTLGGLLRTAYSYKGEHENLGVLIEYLENQQEVNAVTVIPETEVDASLIESEKPDAVVIAVGGKRENRLESSEHVPVVNFSDINTTDLGERVVILGAGVQATDLALFLLANGKKVQLVHEGVQTDISKEQSMWVRNYLIPYLNAQGVRIWNSSSAKSVSDEGVIITNSYDTEMLLPCDSVIECYDLLPDTELYDSIKDDYETYAVGDCCAPWNIADAILRGNVVGRKIGS